MIKITPCIIELNVDSQRFDVYDKNKIKANEHKGHTSTGTPIHYYALYRMDGKGVFFGYYTPFELMQTYGSYSVRYE